MAEDGYGVALMCLNGHMLDDAIECNSAEHAAYCGDCGAETLTACPKCSAPVRGYHQYKTIRVPMYCHNCGGTFPWLQSKLQAANQIAAEADELSDEDRASLAENLPELVSETPNSDVAAVRVRKVLGRLGEGTREALYKLVVDIASEAAKRILTG